MRSLVRVDMDAHDTTVSPKVSSRTTVAALPDAAVAGATRSPYCSDRVPRRLRLPGSDLARAARLRRRAGWGDTVLEPFATSGPRKFRPSSAARMSRSRPSSVFVQSWLSDRQTPRAHAAAPLSLEGPARRHDDPRRTTDSAFSPHRRGTVPAALQAQAWCQRGGNVESHHSASSRQQQT